MLRHAPHSPADGEWIFVTEKRPCRICGACEGCRNGYEGQFAACLHRRSQWPLAPGGWLHRLELRLMVDRTTHNLAEMAANESPARAST